MATNTRLTNEKLTRAEKEIVSPSDNIRIGESSYIKNLNEKEFNKLSGSALREFKKPKPLLSRTGPLSTNQKLKQLSTSFAPVGSDIVVLSEFGPDETTILLGDSCFTITQTALDDKIYKGASRWSRSNGCGKYDKFDGQLQKSLDKYLKN
ncbi:MAG: hypothetical protein ABJK37_11760 [Paraglaciecola sp.]|uniref:hypothetical protein n=1 Tax=Paraglaciecola sp. TaxID=1920173 RepID=UPI00329842EB